MPLRDELGYAHAPPAFSIATQTLGGPSLFKKALIPSIDKDQESDFGFGEPVTLPVMGEEIEAPKAPEAPKAAPSWGFTEDEVEPEEETFRYAEWACWTLHFDNSFRQLFVKLIENPGYASNMCMTTLSSCDDHLWHMSLCKPPGMSIAPYTATM